MKEVTESEHRTCIWIFDQDLTTGYMHVQAIYNILLTITTENRECNKCGGHR